MTEVSFKLTVNTKEMNMENTARELEVRNSVLDVIEALQKVEITGGITLKLELNQPVSISKGEIETKIQELARVCNVPLQIATGTVAEEQKKELTAKLRQLEKWIDEGKYTKQKLIDMYVKKFAGQRSSIVTMLSQCKNKKYNKFDKLVIEDERGVFKFAE